MNGYSPKRSEHVTGLPYILPQSRGDTPTAITAISRRVVENWRKECFTQDSPAMSSGKRVWHLGRGRTDLGSS